MCILEQTSNLKNISDWKPLEKELFFKGIEIFGRNRYANPHLDLFVLGNFVNILFKFETTGKVYC